MWKWICSLFSQPAQNVHEEMKTEIFVQEEKSVEEIHFEDAIKIALDISSDFEGDGGFGNIVGDFDGQCLTCGALGWTWKFGEQQKMVLYCEKLYPGCIQKYMPTQGGQYLFLCTKPVAGTSEEISSWSSGATVKSPHYSELKAFWGSSEMTGVQVYYAKSIANKAMGYATAWTKARNGSVMAPTLQEFCFFFDVVVNNGSLLGLSFSDVSERLHHSGEAGVMEEITQWCGKQQNKDCRKNGIYWKTLSVSQLEVELLVMGWLRSMKSKSQWQASVMNRRGLISVGSGYNEGVKKDFYTKYPLLKNVTVVAP